MDQRIRIRPKMSWIRNTALKCIFFMKDIQVGGGDKADLQLRRRRQVRGYCAEPVLPGRAHHARRGRETVPLLIFFTVFL